ncbi:MAG: glutathione S-transferase [Moraxellaceae bacterium]|nr:MAG: glutathione S-transferase [Moraxellaceae bacterium]
MKEEVILHQWAISPFCGKVRRILDDKNIAYRVKNYNGALVAKAASLSSAGKLPVLDINGKRIADSRQIATYLEKEFDSTPLVPKNSQQQAVMNIYQDWADESLYWYCFYFRLNYDNAWEQVATYFSEGRPSYEKLIVRHFGRVQYKRNLMAQGIGRYSKSQVEERFLFLLDQLNETLHEKHWLVGDRKTLADIAVASQLHEIKRTSHLVSRMSEFKEVERWLVSNEEKSFPHC